MAVFGNRPTTDAPGPHDVFAVPGGSLGLKSSNLVQVVRKLKSGLPYQSLAAFQRNSGLQLEIIGQVIQIPRRTLARRKVQGRFTPQESERLLRLAMVFEKAVELFEGSVAAARQWLCSSNKALGNNTPLAMVETEIGAREVEDLIGRLEHGVFS
ncbi:MAG: antitoxin Xre/MbcA/ParS toxin-binding domain-containing protein [Pirellulales bacterium]